MIIYKAENLINGKVYIGKTVQTLNRRKQIHIAQSKRGIKFYFHYALNKYGSNNFEWTIIAETDSKENLSDLERFYISEYKKNYKVYNMTEGGEGAIGEENYFYGKHFIGEKNPHYGKRHSEETKKIISEKNKGMVAHNKGISMSEEQKKKISESKKGKSNIKLKGRIITEEQKKKQSIAMKGRTSPNKGKSMGEEQKKKLSLYLKGKMSGENNPMYGKKRPDLSERNKQRGNR